LRREDFEHVVAAAAEVTGHDEFVVIGSQAILGTYDKPSAALLVSLEVDIYPLHLPSAAAAVDGSLGDGSPFHAAFGYYAHGVGPETAKAPEDWQSRLVRHEIPLRVAAKQKPVAWCLEVHDLVLSKCVAGRERDWEYARVALKAGLVEPTLLLGRIPELPVGRAHRLQVEKMLRSMISSTPTDG
jgi:hypothetical protein